jgi:2-keto-4-pentenoate hydratase
MSDTTQQAADLLWDCWTQERRIDVLPAAIQPRTREEGYAIQQRLEQRSASPLFGWKIAATSKAGQAHIAVDGPLAGRLLRERVIPDGGEIPFGNNHMQVAEAEFAFRVGVSLPPQRLPYTTSEVLDAVATVYAAIEVPDSRYEDFTIVGAPQLIADNACAHYFVLGTPAPVDWRELDLAMHRAHGRVTHADGSTLERDGIGQNVLGDPRDALAWLVNELSGLGITLHAGEVVTTGTCLVPLAIAPGDLVEADFGLLGRVSVRIG